MMRRSVKGFTLVELIVVMAIFIVVIMITSDSFKTLLSQMVKLTKAEESNISGVVGLEMFRHDLQQVGYGLPYSFIAPISYAESGVDPADDFNDGTGGSDSAVPRAAVAGDNLASGTAGPSGSEPSEIVSDSDYLALKGVTLATSTTAQRWTYMPYSSVTTGKLRPRTWDANNLDDATDLVTVLRRRFSGSAYVNELVVKSSTEYWTTYEANGFTDTAYNPTLQEEVYYLYGIQPGGSLRMPFNRADYFVARPTTAGRMPVSCAPGTGILYKATVNHVASAVAGAGELTYTPLLDCVADMQVTFGFDLTDGSGQPGQDGVIDTYSNADGSTVSGAASDTIVQAAMADAEQLRNSLKIIKIYLLAQIGRRDTAYTSQGSMNLWDAPAGSGPVTSALGKTYVLAADQLNYRWKVYRVVVRPKNLLTNQ